MNYRHAYHAGNAADVLKHAVLCRVLQSLRLKPKPFHVLDSHAGRGRYDLAGAEADKTGEWRRGIGALFDRVPAPDSLAPYLDAVRAANPDGRPRVYPGSPALAAAALRDGDRLTLVEAHPEEHGIVKALFRGDRRVAVHARDGYEALKGLLPPAERRGLVLIDPPYERTDERVALVRGLEVGRARFPAGCFLLWYPVKADAERDRLLGDLASLGLTETLILEHRFEKTMVPDGALAGSGMAVVNPPYSAIAGLEALARDLDGVLAGRVAIKGLAAPSFAVP